MKHKLLVEITVDSPESRDEVIRLTESMIEAGRENLWRSTRDYDLLEVKTLEKKEPI